MRILDQRMGRPGRLPAPVEGLEARLDPAPKAMLEQVLRCSVVGSPETVAEGMKAFAERTDADEIIVTGAFHDHAAQLRSFEIAASVRA
jgi:alkanesulfonate monooxygenase SsuD/methylene tetrahydromethanopterin reductase-like flavin-dependent oxidoreductase (luciferase family)